MEMGTLTFDIDGTICSQEKDYSQAKPNFEVIKKINESYDKGHQIDFYTARGSGTGIDWTETTLAQLKEWGVKYHNLYFGKPASDLYVDDRAICANQWFPHIDYQAMIDKVWGKEYLLVKTDSYAFKRLEVHKDKNLSKQYHRLKHETWHIVQGEGIAIINNKQYNIKPGNTFVIPPNTIHQVKSLSEPLIIIEASTTELDDIVRLERTFQCM